MVKWPVGEFQVLLIVPVQRDVVLMQIPLAELEYPFLAATHSRNKIDG
jgi:hypothetical protein